MGARSKPRELLESDGPFRYVYASISAVVGVNLPPDAGDVEVCGFPNLGSRAILTREWDMYAAHIDRSAALGHMMLTGLVGRPRFGKLSPWINRLENLVFGNTGAFERRLLREADAAKAIRHKEHASSGCYLAYMAEGDLLAPVNLQIARRIGEAGFGFDMIEAATYRDIHKRAVHSTATALSLALSETSSSPEIRFLADAVYLTGPEELFVYPKTITGGAISVAVASQCFTQAAHAAAAAAPVLMQDTKLDSAVDLFVQSQQNSYDNLRAFIAAWSALELLVNRLARVYREQFQTLLADSAALPAWDRDLRALPLEEYRMRDRFFSAACVLGLDSAGSDAEEFSSINGIRSDYYHTMTVAEINLPTQRAQHLFRKYLKLALARAAAP